MNVVKRLENSFRHYLRVKKSINNRRMNEITRWCVLFVNECKIPHVEIIMDCDRKWGIFFKILHTKTFNTNNTFEHTPHSFFAHWIFCRACRHVNYSKNVKRERDCNMWEIPTYAYVMFATCNNITASKMLYIIPITYYFVIVSINREGRWVKKCNLTDMKNAFNTWSVSLITAILSLWWILQKIKFFATNYKLQNFII